MKTLMIFLTLVIFSSLNAQDLDLEMQNIRQASPQERVKLMNELKRRIAKMNQNERSDAINQLRAQIKGHKPSRESVNKQQFMNSHESFHNQQNNQHQAGNQMIDDNHDIHSGLPRLSL